MKSCTPASTRIESYVNALAFLVSIYHVVYVFVLPWGTTHHTILHVGLALILVLLPRIVRGATFPRVLSAIALIMAGVSIPFFLVEAAQLEMKYGMGLTRIEFCMAVAVLAATIAAVYVEWGITIAALTIGFICYLLFGHMLPGPLQAPQLPSHDYAMTFLAAGGSSGIFSGVADVSAQYIFLFILFGAVLSATGIIPMFLELGKFFGQVVRGGAAFTAIIGSSLMGTVTGATVANVALTGPVTIPIMKKQGYRSTDAVAIESAASCGGQLLPPIMGTGAILMASFLGMPYITIVSMAIIPALIYYISLVVTVVVIAENRGIVVDKDPVNWRLVVQQLPFFAIPLLLIIYILVIGRSAQTAIIWGLMASIGLSVIRPGNLRSPSAFLDNLKELAKAFASGGRQAAEIAIVLAAIAVVAQTLVSAAVAPKLTIFLRGFAGDEAFLWLVFSMVGCIILGFGMPTAAAYTLVALLMVPAMTEIGVEPVLSHFFVFYFAVYAAVTPPVATAVIVGSRIGQASFWRSAGASMKLMGIPLVLPFAFVYHPSLLGLSGWNVDLLKTTVMLLLIAYFIAVINYGDIRQPGKWIDAILAIAGLGAGVAWLFLDLISVFFSACLIAIILIMKARSRVRFPEWKRRVSNQ